MKTIDQKWQFKCNFKFNLMEIQWNQEAPVHWGWGWGRGAAASHLRWEMTQARPQLGIAVLKQLKQAKQAE